MALNAAFSLYIYTLIISLIFCYLSTKNIGLVLLMFSTIWSSKEDQVAEFCLKRILWMIMDDPTQGIRFHLPLPSQPLRGNIMP